MKRVFFGLLTVFLAVSLFAGGGSQQGSSAGGSAASGGAANSNPLSDVRVRQALTHAIDVDTLCRTILLDKAVPANNLTPNIEGKASGLPEYKYNPQRARDLLRAANWNANYVLDVGYYYEDQQSVDLMTAIQAYWEAVGVKANFRRISGDLNTLLWSNPKDPVKGPSAVDWDVLYAAKAAFTVHDYYNMFGTGFSGNSHTPGDPKWDELIAASNSTADLAKLRTAFQGLQRYENEVLPVAPLYYQPLFIFSRNNLNRIGDSNGNAQFCYDWNIVNWTVTPDASGKQILRTNSGPAQFFEYPWFNPGIYIGNKVLFDRLIVADGNLNPKTGGLATYETAADYMSIVFTLRNNVKWHDGSALTAQDVKWSIEYALKVPAVNPTFSVTFNSIEGAAAYEAGNAQSVSGITINGNRITIKFTTLDPNMLLTFSQFPILPEKYFQGVDPAQFQQAPYFQKPIGSGPFMIKEVRMNDYVIFEPFKDYFGGVAKIDEIHAYPSGENDGNLIVNAQAGRIDYGYSKSSADAVALERIPGMNVYPVNMLYTRFLYFNKFPRKETDIFTVNICPA
jgi:peptide/nickel transport system substrate-binding protein